MEELQSPGPSVRGCMDFPTCPTCAIPLGLDGAFGKGYGSIGVGIAVTGEARILQARSSRVVTLTTSRPSVHRGRPSQGDICHPLYARWA